MSKLITENDVAADFFWIDYLCRIAKKQVIDVPIVACAVADNYRLIASAVNSTVAKNDPCAHAEIELLRSVSNYYGNYRLDGITIYVNLEPCLMCYGALLHARVGRLVFGCTDSKFGVLSRHFGLHEHGSLNHKFAWRGNVRQEKCTNIIRQFFISKR